LQNGQKTLAGRLQFLRPRVERPDRGSSERRRVAPLVVVLVLVSAFYLATAGRPQLFDQIDGQYAGAAREMLVRGDWLVPTQDGIPRLQKPPLTYWLILLSYRVLSVSEFSARLPITLATVGWFFAVATLAAKVSGRQSFGWASGIILATFAGTYFFAHLVMPEPLFALLLTLCFYALVAGAQAPSGKEQDRWLTGAWLFLSLATLTKGMHGFLLPFSVLGGCAAVQSNSRVWIRRFFSLPQGWLIFFFTVLPWYLAVESRYPGFLADHLGNEQLGSAFNNRWPRDSDRVPLLIFWFEHLVLWAPWTLFLPAAIASYRATNPRFRLRGQWPLLAFWFVLYSLGITFAHLQDYYLMLVWPMVAMFIAAGFVRRDGLTPRFFAIPGWVLVAIGVGLGVVGFWLGTASAPDPGAEVGSHYATTIWASLSGLSVDTLAGFRWLAWVTGLTFLVAGSLIVWFAGQRQRLVIIGVVAIAMLISQAAGWDGLQLVDNEFSSGNLCQEILRRAAGVYNVVCDYQANDLTSIYFYLPHQVLYVDANPRIEFATRSLQIGRSDFLNRPQLRDLWKSSQQTFLVTDVANVSQWSETLGQDLLHPVAVFGTKALLVNR
jgi:4-amino-4-deoxy-L-arabinose transferase-like glycosyltransferase